jgi:hypothetical protein
LPYAGRGGAYPWGGRALRRCVGCAVKLLTQAIDQLSNMN